MAGTEARDEIAGNLDATGVILTEHWFVVVVVVVCLWKFLELNVMTDRQ